MRLHLKITSCEGILQQLVCPSLCCSEMWSELILPSVSRFPTECFHVWESSWSIAIKMISCENFNHARWLYTIYYRGVENFNILCILCTENVIMNFTNLEISHYTPGRGCRKKRKKTWLLMSVLWSHWDYYFFLESKVKLVYSPTHSSEILRLDSWSMLTYQIQKPESRKPGF